MYHYFTITYSGNEFFITVTTVFPQLTFFLTTNWLLNLWYFDLLNLLQWDPHERLQPQPLQLRLIVFSFLVSSGFITYFIPQENKTKTTNILFSRLD